MSAFPDVLTSEFLFDADINLAPTLDLGATPLGTRSIYNVTGGTFGGPKLRGTFLPGGADWLLTLANGGSELDVRAAMQTDDGALIYVSYRGVIDIPPDVATRLFGADGDSVDMSEYYFRTTPRFETGSEKYDWLNKTVCVGVGRPAPGNVRYRIFAVK